RWRRAARPRYSCYGMSLDTPRRDSRRTHMATHHVSRRRVRTAPVGQLTASPGERGSKTALAQARRTRSKLRYCFSQWERLTTEPANSIEVWQGANVLHFLSCARERNQ